MHGVSSTSDRAKSPKIQKKVGLTLARQNKILGKKGGKKPPLARPRFPPACARNTIARSIASFPDDDLLLSGIIIPSLKDNNSALHHRTSALCKANIGTSAS